MDLNKIQSLLPPPEETPQPFILLDAITMYSPERIKGLRRFEQTRNWQALEAAAQLASFHLRILKDFQWQTFLLSIEEFVPPSGPILNALVGFEAVLTYISRYVAEYEVTLAERSLETRPKTGQTSRILAAGRLHIGMRPYSDEFKNLAEYYKKLGQNLCGNSFAIA